MIDWLYSRSTCNWSLSASGKNSQRGEKVVTDSSLGSGVRVRERQCLGEIVEVMDRDRNQ